MLSKPALQETLKKMGLPSYRASQILHSVYGKGLLKFDEMTDLPLVTRSKLAEQIGILGITPEHIARSADGKTEKILFRLSDGNMIETVLMRFNDGRNSVCVSSQAGCRLGCRFCATGTSGFFRDLTAGEIFDQALFCHSLLVRSGSRISNVVYMGMGEPFLNYENVIESLHMLNDKQGMNLGARSITVSTSGICEGIERLADEPLQVNLAVSLHAPNQELREKIMPVAKLYPLERLMGAINGYISKTRRRVSYEYVMLKGVNDGLKQAGELAKLVKGQLCHINLIPYNVTGIDGISGSQKNAINDFSAVLKKAGLPVTVRVSLGQDIAAACGQLANKKNSKP